MARGELTWSLQLAGRSGEVPEEVKILGQVTRPHLQAKLLMPLANCLPHTDIAAQNKLKPLLVRIFHHQLKFICFEQSARHLSAEQKSTTAAAARLKRN